MKALGQVRVYGDRPMVTFGYSYGRQLCFEDPAPAVGAIVCVEIPDLETASTEAVIAWLRARSGQSSSRRELFELPSDVWRDAVLDDFVDADFHQHCVWQISSHFSAEELDAFTEKWLPLARAEAREALGVQNEHARAEALMSIGDRLRRIYAVVGNVPNQLHRQMNDTFELVERAQLNSLRVSNPPPEEWVEVAIGMKTQAVVRETLSAMVKRLRRQRVRPERVAQLLMTIHGTLHEQIRYFPELWSELEPLLELAPNVSGETIDITDAREEIAMLSWPLWSGRRVGQVVPGRTALVVYEGSTPTFIRGERKLKFRVLRAGGSLEAHGNTLVVREQSDAIGAALLEVDRLDTLAQVNPRQAMQALAGLDVAPQHPVFDAAEAAESDPRQGRVLADLLIELVVGIDADIARGMARAQARGNRR